MAGDAAFRGAADGAGLGRGAGGRLPAVSRCRGLAVGIAVAAGAGMDRVAAFGAGGLHRLHISIAVLMLFRGDQLGLGILAYGAGKALLAVFLLRSLPDHLAAVPGMALFPAIGDLAAPAGLGRCAGGICPIVAQGPGFVVGVAFAAGAGEGGVAALRAVGGRHRFRPGMHMVSPGLFRPCAGGIGRLCHIAGIGRLCHIAGGHGNLGLILTLSGQEQHQRHNQRRCHNCANHRHDPFIFLFHGDHPHSLFLLISWNYHKYHSIKPVCIIQARFP